MGKFKIPYQLILLITVPVLIVSLSLAATFRMPDVYNFYFNDSQVTNLLYTEYTNSEIADVIADFMGSFSPEEFQIYEDTGYDMQGIFSDEDSSNMLNLKKIVDFSTVMAVLSFIGTAIVYYLYLKRDDKYTLRKTYRMTLPISIVLGVIQAGAFKIQALRHGWFGWIGWQELPDNSCLQAILGDGFWSMFAVFLAAITAVVLGVLTYVNYRLTKPPRIFF